MTPSPPPHIPGGWIPLSKALVRELPHDRPFTKLEAMFSMTLDYDQGNPVTVNGYAELWGWSRGKVNRFFEEIGAAIEYPGDTVEKQNQRGQIVIQITDRSRTENGQIKAIDSRWLREQADRKRADDGQKTNRSQYTTREPNPKPINPPLFLIFWNAYPRKTGKAAAEKAWKKINPNDALLAEILTALEWQAQLEDWRKEDGKYIPHPATWLNGRRWEDEPPNSRTAKVIPMDRHQPHGLNIIGEEIPA